MSNTKRPTFKKLILADLKAAGHHTIISKIKSITYECFSGGDAVRIRTLNLFKPEREILESLMDEYKDQDFDGMTDSTTYRPANGKERRASYVTLSNEFTDNLREDIITMLALEGVTNDEEAKASYNTWYSQLINRQLYDLTGV